MGEAGHCIPKRILFRRTLRRAFPRNFLRRLIRVSAWDFRLALRVPFRGFAG